MSMGIFHRVTISQTWVKYVQHIMLQNVYEHAKDSQKHEIVDAK